MINQGITVPVGNPVFSGKTGHHIRSYGRIGNLFMDGLDHFFKDRNRIGPVHSLQNSLVAALKRNVKMPAQPVAGGNHFDELLMNFIGLQGTEPYSQRESLLLDNPKQSNEIYFFRQIDAVFSKMNSREHHLFVAVLRKGMKGRNDLFGPKDFDKAPG